MKSLKFYQFLYLLSLALLMNAVCARVGRMFTVYEDVVYEIYNFCLIYPDGAICYSTIWFGAVLVIALLLTLLGLVMSFCNRILLQKRVVAWSMALLVGYYVVYGFCLYYIFAGNDDVNTLNLDDVHMFFPLFSIILNATIYFVVRRNEKRIKRVDP